MMQFGMLKTMPMRDYVVATSVGIVNGEAMIDLCYEEDSRADVDMNVVMTGSGKFIELQATAERGSFDDGQMAALIRLARGGLSGLLAAQQQAAPLK
jgi:ribonuclease PH